MAFLPFSDAYNAQTDANTRKTAADSQQVMGALDFSNKFRAAKRDMAIQDVVQNSGGDYARMSEGLARLGALPEAEHARKLGVEQGIARDLPGAFGPEGANSDKLAELEMRRNNFGGALSHLDRGTALREKVAAAGRNRAALSSLQGSPAQPRIGPTLDDQGETMPGVPARPGAFDEMAQNSNPDIASRARLGQRMIEAGAFSTGDKAAEYGQKIGESAIRSADRGYALADRAAGRDARANEVSHWDSKRGVAITRSGDIIVPEDLPEIKDAGDSKQRMFAKWRIETLVQSGMPLSEAQRLIASGGASGKLGEKDLGRMATELMKLKDDNFNPIYKSLDEAVAAAKQAVVGQIGAQPKDGALDQPGSGALSGWFGKLKDAGGFTNDDKGKSNAKAAIREARKAGHNDAAIKKAMIDAGIGK